MLTRLVADARAAGLLVILDAKRGDVGSTNDAYARAYLGLAAMDAFTGRAHAADAYVFVVTRSSNPEGRAIQSSLTSDGVVVESALLAEIAALNVRLSAGGVGPVGAVVADVELAATAVLLNATGRSHHAYTIGNLHAGSRTGCAHGC